MHQFGDGDHAGEGMTAEERKTKIDQAGELEKGEDENEDGHRNGDDRASGEPKSDHGFTSRGGEVVSLSLHGDEGQEEHSEEKENSGETEGEGSFEALGLIGVERASAGVAVGSLSFFDQLDIME